MAAEEHAEGAGGYIRHHLTHLSNNPASTGPVDFSVIHWDSVFFSTVIGFFALWMLWRAARHSIHSAKNPITVEKKTESQWMTEKSTGPVDAGLFDRCVR